MTNKKTDNSPVMTPGQFDALLRYINALVAYGHEMQANQGEADFTPVEDAAKNARILLTGEWPR
jgi:hypothetical protein